MNTQDERYSRFGLIRDMLETAEIIRQFDASVGAEAAQAIAQSQRLLMTGEGSSRLFPAKNAIAHARRQGWPLVLHTEAALQAKTYALQDWSVFALSNSGRTAEVIELFSHLQSQGHDRRFSLTAFPQTKLQSLASHGYVLKCGPEGAVAATKSVVEQALVYRAVLEQAVGKPQMAARLGMLAQQFEQALTTAPDAAWIETAAGADLVYWAGLNDGVAEELTLKTNEITRKPADFLEGTYALHGVEEVMDRSQVVIWLEPAPETQEKIQKVLIEGVGLPVLTIASQPTAFPTWVIPDGGDFSGFVQMAAGWNALVEIGLQLGVDLDKPVITSCGSGVTAAVLSLALETIGHRNHALYDGSWTEWGSYADLKVEQG